MHLQLEVYRKAKARSHLEPKTLNSHHSPRFDATSRTVTAPTTTGTSPANQGALRISPKKLRFPLPSKRKGIVHRLAEFATDEKDFLPRSFNGLFSTRERSSKSFCAPKF